MSSAPGGWLSPKLFRHPNPAKQGWGIYARAPIKRGEVLIAWTGRVVDGAHVERLANDEIHHILQVEDDLYLVPFDQPEDPDFVNHSCTPNAHLSGQTVLIAARDIQPFEEVCYDYATSDANRSLNFACQCGTSDCRGTITAEDWQLPELQRRYAGAFSPYLQRRIDSLATGVRVQRRRR